MPLLQQKSAYRLTRIEWQTAFQNGEDKQRCRLLFYKHKLCCIYTEPFLTAAFTPASAQAAFSGSVPAIRLLT